MATAPALQPTEALVRVKPAHQDLPHSSQRGHGAGRLDLSIARGEFVCVVGPSGCGKTTLLNVVGGLESPGSDSVVFSPLARRVE